MPIPIPMSITSSRDVHPAARGYTKTAGEKKEPSCFIGWKSYMGLVSKDDSKSLGSEHSCWFFTCSLAPCWQGAISEGFAADD